MLFKSASKGNVIIHPRLQGVNVIAVHNAVRHGRASLITIIQDADAARMTLGVYDDGTGMPSDPETHGMGLRVMGFRAKIISAVLDIHSPEAGGTTVQVSLGRS